MKITKLKHQLYIFQITISLFLFLFLGLTYFAYQEQYKKDIDTQIENEISLHKKEISSSIRSATTKLNKQKDYFKSIHKETLNLLKKNPDLDLNKLKDEIKSKYLSSNIEVELFLIDKTYTVYKTTYLKDLGFNLSVVTEAKDYLDRTSEDGNIYVSDFVSTDALDMKYKLYSYSRLKDGVYFEMGFIDNSLTNTMESLVKETNYNSTTLTLYNVSKDDKQYYYYPMNTKKDITSKEEYYKTLVKVPLNKTINDYIINCIKFNKTIHLQNDGIHTVYIKIFEKSVFDILGFDNIVLHLKIDISDKMQFMQDYKNIFFFSLLVSLILLLFLFILLKNRFTKPIEEIVNSIQNSKKVDDPTIFSLNNELSEISQKYNFLYDELYNEIKLNKKLILIDPLTSAYNRKAFDNSINEELLLFNRYQTPFSLILLDIDNFKQINDEEGHIVGDNVLKTLVHLANEEIRSTDTFYRIGGDEFTIICRNTILSDVINVAEKLRAKVETSLNILDNRTITVSIGVSQVIQKDTSDSIYIRADENLYYSKRNGKNRVASQKEQ